MEELTEDEGRAYLIAEEHLKEQFLQGFKKERGGLFKRVGEFVMPSFKLNQDKVEVLPNDPSELVKQFSFMVDSKISAAQVAAGESFAGLNDQIEALKKAKVSRMALIFQKRIRLAHLLPRVNSLGCRRTRFQGKHRCHLLSTRHRFHRSPRPVRSVRAVRPVTRSVRPVQRDSVQCLLHRTLLFPVRPSLAEPMR